MIKKILSLVIFGVLTFGMLFADTTATLNVRVSLLEIAPLYTIKIDTKDGNGTEYVTGSNIAKCSTDTGNTVLTIEGTEDFYTTGGGNSDSITVYAKVTQTNFTRWKKSVEIKISATALTLYKDGKKVDGDYTSSTPTFDYYEIHQDTLALTIDDSGFKNTNIVKLDYNSLGFPVLANTDMFRLGITYKISEIKEGTEGNQTTVMPLGVDGSYYQSTVTITYSAN